MKKATAIAPANIAFIKYWGKRNEKLRLPANSSISMNLSEAFTTTSVEFDEKLKKDSFRMGGKNVNKDESERVSKHLNLIRNIAKIKLYARVETKNNFPKVVGIASSASGFAALTLAASSAAELKLSEKELSILARLGSGSACRSVPDGFVEWKEGNGSRDSYAHSLYPHDYWDICDLIAVTGIKGKKVGSSEGHTLAESSPFYKTRILGMKNKVQEVKLSLKHKDFASFRGVLEAEAINMHAVMMTSVPALHHWNPMNLEVMNSVIQLRQSGMECYFTIDAGPNVHIICEGKNREKIKNQLLKAKSTLRILNNKPAEGARLILV